MNQRRVALEALCQTYHVTILYSFGSRAKEALTWLNTPACVMSPGPSDLDIGVKASSGIRWTLAEGVALTQALEDLFGVHRVDLVVLDKANPYLSAEVIHGERLYCADEFQADLYDLYVLRQEADLEFLENERARYLLGVEG